MSLPNLQEYNEAIQAPRICFGDAELRAGIVEQDRLGLPRPRSGNFATVYKLETAGKKWAVKCFNREMRDQQERYAAVNAYLHQVSLPYMVDFTYLADGIRVRGQWYPIVKMEWAEGEPLNFWIQRNLHNPTALLAFSQSFVSMLSAMQQVSIAHGDLQHGNILVVNGAPKLVDYDGMYVPALSGRVSNEIGQPNYQHPNRTASDFGPYLDNFSGWVIQLSLVALSIDPKLWQTFKGGDDCLLFRKRDFEAPNQSVLLRALESERSQELLQAVALFRTVLGCLPQSVPSIDGTFSDMPVTTALPVQLAGASWIYDHLPSPFVRPASVSVRTAETGKIDWVLDATNSQRPPVHFENPVGVIRLLTYFSIILSALIVMLAVRTSSPFLLLSVPLIAGTNLLIWRTRYHSEPAVSQRRSVLLSRSELQERIRVMESRIAEVDSDKQRINRHFSDRRIDLAKQERELLAAEQRTKNGNDSTLQAAISLSLKNKQMLDAQEAKEFNALQSGLGRTVATLAQSIATLLQGETTEVSNTLKAKQTAFVQSRLQQSWIATSPIPGIGATYKARLQGAGFQRASDIDYYGVQRVQGIGDARANALRAWRQAIETNATSQMPQTLTFQEEGAIRTKYASQKSTLQVQLAQNQKDLKNQESNIRAKFAGLKVPHDSLMFAERQKHQLELDRITTEYRQKRESATRNVREQEQDQIRALGKLESQQNELRNEIFQLQWKMGKVEREIRRFSGIRFRSYAGHVFLFR